MKYLNYIIILIVICSISCKKEWLDAKPNTNLVVPSSLSDLQGLLDNNNVCNIHPSLSEVGSDNYYIEPSTIASQASFTVNGYIWAQNGWQDNTTIFDWSIPYNAIFYANRALEGLGNVDVTSANKSAWDNIYGSALFIRSAQLFNLVSLFSKPYNPSTALSDLGVPLRLESDITIESGRGNLQNVYGQILKDLKESINYLPVNPSYKSRPSKGAALGMLARIYLAMELYDSAFVYTNAYLQQYNTLMDYNTLNTTGPISMPQYNNNPEIIYYAQMIANSGLNQSRATIDSMLYASYSSDDLRKSVLFRKSGLRNVWAGSYTGAINLNFTGIATDEMFLIRAECYARFGNISSALDDLNTLMQNRWVVSAFVPIIAVDSNEALVKILEERRKELLYRGIRWNDLRRLNKDVQFAKEIIRFYNNQAYTLKPNEAKYVWPIPDDEIIFSGIQQNER